MACTSTALLRTMLRNGEEGGALPPGRGAAPELVCKAVQGRCAKKGIYGRLNTGGAPGPAKFFLQGVNPDLFPDSGGLYFLGFICKLWFHIWNKLTQRR
ncbi:hypothetical protein [Cupriavidus sp. UME77]|uniref:hypothetical protein n=1 Tax=Cupriavidus sp. UME77 TaxID=1862321 RepID=UPI0015FECCB0|nr:hypothetical protein [Cupriavidus sp. UME77]